MSTILPSRFMWTVSPSVSTCMNVQGRSAVAKFRSYIASIRQVSNSDSVATGGDLVCLSRDSIPVFIHPHSLILLYYHISSVLVTLGIARLPSFILDSSSQGCWVHDHHLVKLLQLLHDIFYALVSKYLMPFKIWYWVIAVTMSGSFRIFSSISYW